MPALLFAVTCALGALVLTRPVRADEARVQVTTDRLDITFSQDGAGPVHWRACHPSCVQADEGRGTSIRLGAEPDPLQARLAFRGPGTPVDLQRLLFTAALSEDPHARIVTFASDLPVQGVRLVKAFEISKDRYVVVMTVRLLGPNAAAFADGRRLEIEIGAGQELFPPPAAGFAAMLDRVDRVILASQRVRAVPDDAREPTAVRAGDWAAVRGRFWALMVRPDEPATLAPRPGMGLALLADDPARLSWRYTFYSGPIESRALLQADPPLTGMLLSGLWPWLRALGLALLALLRTLTALLGHPGAGIIALAVAVKVLLLPVTMIAGRLQEQVNAAQARLQPGIEAINAVCSGEERARRTLALYREQGVHPLYPVKSLVGFLIQIPVFIAVFDMLAENFDLYRVSFLWMRDLSWPDELLRLPACLAFFGCHLNLLPFLMTGVSLVAVLRYRSSVLTSSLARRQRRHLTGVTLAFLVLFYTFPAGMVLYWTSTNSVQLVIQELTRRLGRATTESR